jgi:hypothetical protein
MLSNAMIGGNTLAMPEPENHELITQFEQPWLADRLADLALSKTGSFYDVKSGDNERPVEFVPAADIHVISSGEQLADLNHHHYQDGGNALQLSSPDDSVEYRADSVRRKRRKKMRRHKYRKRLKETRAQRRRTKQRKENAALKAEA